MKKTMWTETIFGALLLSLGAIPGRAQFPAALTQAPAGLNGLFDNSRQAGSSDVTAPAFAPSARLSAFLAAFGRTAVLRTTLVATQQSSSLDRPQAAVPPLPQAVADEGLKLFKSAAASMPKIFGFRSQAEVNSAVLGPSLRQYFVRADDLADFQRGQNALTLLKKPTAIIVLVEVSGQARSVLEFHYDGRSWSIGMFGASNLAQAISAVMPPFRGLAIGPDCYLITIPALYSEFLGVRATTVSSSAGLAISLFGNNIIGLKAGQSKTVDEVFAELQPHAKQLINNQPNAPGGQAPHCGAHAHCAGRSLSSR